MCRIVLENESRKALIEMNKKKELKFNSLLIFDKNSDKGLTVESVVQLTHIESAPVKNK